MLRVAGHQGPSARSTSQTLCTLPMEKSLKSTAYLGMKKKYPYRITNLLAGIFE
jgi:hypothetical protein